MFDAPISITKADALPAAKLDGALAKNPGGGKGKK